LLAGQTGQLITVHGSGFIRSSQVQVNGGAVATTFIDASTLSFTLPSISGATSVSIQVVNPGPGGGPSAAVSLTLTVPTPTISDISPSSGISGATAGITLTGTNFLQGATVSFGGTPVSPVSLTSTQIVIVVGLSSVGPQSVTVSNPGGQASNAVTFTVNAPPPPPPPPAAPAITQISPNSGNAGAVVPVMLTGTGFTGLSAITVSGTAITVTNVQAISSTTATATFSIAGNAAPGSVNVTVTATGGTSAFISFTILSSLPAPTLTALSPIGASQGQGNITLTATGTNFAGTTAMQFNFNGAADAGITATNVTANAGGTQLTATVNVSSTAMVGTHSIQITRTGQNFTGGNFLVYAAGSPALYTLTPTQSAVGGSVGIAITGASLAGINELFFFPQAGSADNGIAVTGITASASSLTANLNISSGALIGPHSVSMASSTGSTFISYPTNANFIVTTSTGLYVTKLSSPVLPRGSSGTAITVSGANLAGVTGISFYNPDGTLETGITAGGFTASASSLSANLTLDPNMSVGPRSLGLNFAGGVQVVTTLTINVSTQVSQGSIYVNSIGPPNAPAGSSFPLNLNGGGLTGISGVKFQVNGTDDSFLRPRRFRWPATTRLLLLWLSIAQPRLDRACWYCC
jgi:hypothetical protein